jgi:Glutaredoxin-like domain (DUF836)
MPNADTMMSDPANPRFVLFQRDDCHLCDLALEVLAKAGVPDFDSVFIEDDTSLETNYGHRVPVLRRSDGTELDWPFDPDAVRRAMAG